MLNKEIENKFDINIFERPEEYEQFIEEKNMGSSYGNRAKATINSKGEATIAIDKSYYLSGGIKPKEIEAIIIHEKIEILDSSSNPHKKGVFSEYEFIRQKFGIETLRKYHSNLCNLMGGDNSIRNEVLSALVDEKNIK